MTKKKTRCFYNLSDRRLEIMDLTPASQAVVDERYRCSGKGCPNLSSHWHRQPEPINIVVDRVTPAWIERIGHFDIMALDTELVDALAPHCRDILFGTVSIDEGYGDLQPTRFVTVTAPAPRRIQSDRGQYCLHMRWPCCGVFTNTIGSADGAIVERTLDDRLIYIDQDGHVLVADELVKSLDLKHRFPKLRFERIDVVPEPLDKETLPDDPGWNGTLQRTYTASVGVVVYIPQSSSDRVHEQRIFGEFRQRLDEELLPAGAENVHRDKGSHGSCAFHTRGHDTESLRKAVLRALSGWRVGAQFSISLHQFDDMGSTEVEHITIAADSTDAEDLLAQSQRQ